MLQKRYFFLIIICLTVPVAIWFSVSHLKKRPAIKVGILHSLSGKFAPYERPILDATLLAVEEINARGGIAGRTLIPIVKDGASDYAQFAKEAKHLITQEHVAVIFGCWSSPDRKAVKPIVERYNSLLFYPVHHEGLEESPNIVYTSTIPNQQAIPAATWCLKNLGNSFFLVGSDELLPRATNEILKETIALFDGTIVGEEYIQSKNNNIADIVQKIAKAEPQVIINTIIGQNNKTFFSMLRKAGISSEKIPTMSLCIDESELDKYDAKNMIGNYSAWSHFQSLERSENSKFVGRMKQRYGQSYKVSDAAESGYYGVYLWKQAALKAHTFNTANIQRALRNQAFDAPEGIIYVDDASLHTWSVMSIGKIRSDKQFTVLWNSVKAIKPMAYPFFKSRKEWNSLLEQWYKQWGNKWSGY